MMSEKKGFSVECVLIRHVMETRRGDTERIMEMVRCPFPQSGSMSTSGVEWLVKRKPGTGWLLAVEFQRLGWLALFANVPMDQLYQANCQSRRLQVAYVLVDPASKTWVLEVTSAGKRVAQLHGTTDDLGWRESLICEDRELRHSLLGFDSIEAAIDCLGDHFSIPIPFPSVTVSGGKFVVLGKSGKPVTTGVGRFKVFDINDRDESEDEESDESADPDVASNAIRALIASMNAGSLPQPLESSESESDALTAERRRFAQIAKADYLDQNVPANPELQFIQQSRLAGFEEYDFFAGDLRNRGFEEAAHLISKTNGRTLMSVFVDPLRKMEAVISDDGPLGDGTLRLEIASYHPDGTVTCVSNKETLQDPDLNLTLFERHHINQAEPESLVAALHEKVAKRDRLATPTEDCESRIRDIAARLLKELRDAAQDLRRQTVRLADGTLPRYERVGVYMRADATSEAVVESCFEEVSQDSAKFSKASNLESTVRAAATLAAVDHLQFAGALNETSLYRSGIQSARALFSIPQLLSKASYFDAAETFAYAMALAMNQNDEGTAKLICESLTPMFSAGKLRMNNAPPVVIAETQLLIANRLRSRKVNGSKTRRVEILEGRSPQAKHLVACLDAMDEGTGDAFAQSLSASVQTVARQKKRQSYAFDLYRAVAWNESIVWHLANRAGLKLPALSAETRDWLLVSSSQSVGLD